MAAIGTPFLIFACMSVTPSFGQGPRKVASRVQPEYPLTLKSMGIGGLVRLQATVLANGTVTEVSILGGNPILAEKAAAAVKQWKYFPAPAQTTELIVLDFHAQRLER